MNRTQLAEHLADRLDLTPKQADQTLIAALDAIADAVAAGESVTLSGFGTFERRARAARTGRNPQTGAVMEIPAGRAPAFKPATAFRRRVAEA